MVFGFNFTLGHGFAAVAALVVLSPLADACRIFGSADPLQALGRITGKGKQVSVDWPGDSQAEFKKKIDRIKSLTKELATRFDSTKLTQLIESLKDALVLHPASEVDNFHHSHRRAIKEAVDLIKELPEYFRVQIPQAVLSALGLEPVTAKVTDKHHEESYDNSVEVSKILPLATGLAGTLPPGKSHELPPAVLDIANGQIKNLKRLIQFEALLLSIQTSFTLVDSTKLISAFAKHEENRFPEEFTDGIPLAVQLERTRQNIYQILGTLGTMLNVELRQNYETAVQELKRTRFELANLLIIFAEKTRIPKTLRQAMLSISASVRNETPVGVRWLKRLDIIKTGESYEPAKVEEYLDQIEDVLRDPSPAVRALLADPQNWQPLAPAPKVTEPKPNPRDRGEQRDKPVERKHYDKYDPKNPEQLTMKDRHDIRRLFPNGTNKRKIYQLFARHLAEVGALDALAEHTHAMEGVTIAGLNGFIAYLGWMGANQGPVRDGINRTILQELMYNHTDAFLRWSTFDHSLERSPLHDRVSSGKTWYEIRSEILEAVKSPPPR